MSKQFLDISQMQHLKELGIDTSKASMYWISYNGISVSIPSNFNLPTSNKDYIICDAFTLQDILDLLPYKIVTNYLNIGKKSFSGDILFYIEYSNFGGYEISHFRNGNLIDAAYSMLCWCIENGYVKTNKED